MTSYNIGSGGLIPEIQKQKTPTKYVRELLNQDHQRERQRSKTADHLPDRVSPLIKEDILYGQRVR